MQIFERDSFEKVIFGGKNEEKTGDIPNQWEKEQQFVGRLLQFDKAEPLLAKIFETCANKINSVIDTQEPIARAIQ